MALYDSYARTRPRTIPSFCEMRYILRLILCCFLAVGLSGCFNLSEDVWISSDSSGRIEVDLSFSERVAALADFKGELTQAINAEDSGIVEFSENGIRHLVFGLDFDDIHQLPELIQKPKEVLDEEGKGIFFAVDELEGRDIHYQQRLNVGNAPTITDDDETDAENIDSSFFGQLFVASVFSDKYFTVSIHSPKILRGNGRLIEDGKGMLWRIPLHEFMNSEGFEKEFDADIRL